MIVSEVGRARLRLLFLQMGCLGALLGALWGCGESDVTRVGAEDVPCAPYGDNRYAGAYELEGAQLVLSVSSASGQCCVLIGASLTYEVADLGASTMTLIDDVQGPTVWLRPTGTEGDITGSWTCEDGQTLQLAASGKFSATDHPSCFEPPACGVIRPALGRGRQLTAFFPWILSALWLRVAAWVCRRPNSPEVVVGRYGPGGRGDA